MLSIRTFDPHKDLKAVFAPFMSPWALLFCYQSQVVAKSFNLTIHVVQYKSWPLLIMNLFSTTLEYSLVYGVILFVSCLFVFSLFEIYYDRKKNLWHIPGPFPLPLVGKLQLQQQFTFVRIKTFFFRQLSFICQASWAIYAHSPSCKFKEILYVLLEHFQDNLL